MDDKELIKRCRHYDRTAQEALYRLYASEMLGVCYRYTKSIDDAEDVLQEAFVKVFTRLQDFREQGALGAWIRRIMVTTAISYLRRHNRYRQQMDFNQPALHVAIDETATVHLQTEALMELIRRLPAGYQTVFNLVGIEGYDHAEVATLLGISVQTSRSQYSRARAQLVKWITEEQTLPAQAGIKS